MMKKYKLVQLKFIMLISLNKENFSKMISPIKKTLNLKMYECKICNLTCPSEYKWNEHIQGKKHQSNLHSNSNPKCQCGKLTNELVVKKDGPNKGRAFYSCPDQICKFFQWKDLSFKSNENQ